jgi:hypothetical protein
MNNPRLNAAVDVVSSDAEKQILDPRTLALLKYKDALQAMQAADQMMAAAQPQPMPSTVAERTKLAAEQGIAGLVSRLSPGIQRQGSNMQAQQLQQAMSGGLPQLPAPNMARMAGGGIVAFQDGGDVEGGVEALIAQFVASGMDPVSAAQEAARTLGISPEVPSTTYGTGDRTGQGENLRGVLQGSGQVMADAARRFAPQSISEEDLLALTTSEGDGRQSRLPEMSEEELLALTTSEGEGAKSAQGLGAFVQDILRSVRGPRGDSPSAASEVDANVNPLDMLNRMYTPTFPEEGFLAGVQRRKAENLADMGYVAPEPPSVSAPAATPTAAPVTLAPAPEMPRTTPQPAPEDMGPNATPAQFLLANAGTSRDAVQAVLEEEQQPRAGESASDRAARMRRLIAGLRGFGAEGLGGFAAGAAEEELRSEQEQIAEQERQRRAAMETRGLDLEEQALAQRNEILQAEAKDRRFNQVMSLVANFQQLADNDRFRLGSAITDATADVTNQLGMLDRAIANPSTNRREREEYNAQRNALAAQLDQIVRGVTESFGQGLDYRPIVESLLRSAMPAGMGATATTISPATLAALEQYGTQ